MTRKRYQLEYFIDRILESIHRIDRAVDGIAYEQFAHDELRHDAVLMNFIRIGESFHDIQKYFSGFVARQPELPVAEAYRLRNRLSHDYTDVRPEYVWRTIHNDLPGIKRSLAQARGSGR